MAVADDLTIAHNTDRKFRIELFSHKIAIADNHLALLSFMLGGTQLRKLSPTIRRRRKTGIEFILFP